MSTSDRKHIGYFLVLSDIYKAGFSLCLHKTMRIRLLKSLNTKLEHLVWPKKKKQSNAPKIPNVKQTMETQPERTTMSPDSVVILDSQPLASESRLAYSCMLRSGAQQCSSSPVIPSNCVPTRLICCVVVVVILFGNLCWPSYCGSCDLL